MKKLLYSECIFLMICIYVQVELDQMQTDERSQQNEELFVDR